MKYLAKWIIAFHPLKQGEFIFGELDDSRRANDHHSNTFNARHPYKLPRHHSLTSLWNIDSKMKIQGFLFIASLLLLATFVQETKGFGPLPPGKRRREPHRKVCIPGMKETLNQFFAQKSFSLTISLDFSSILSKSFCMKFDNSWGLRHTKFQKGLMQWYKGVQSCQFCYLLGENGAYVMAKSLQPQA